MMKERDITSIEGYAETYRKMHEHEITPIQKGAKSVYGHEVETLLTELRRVRQVNKALRIENKELAYEAHGG